MAYGQTAPSYDPLKIEMMLIVFSINVKLKYFFNLVISRSWYQYIYLS